MEDHESFASWVIATGNRRFALVIVLALIAMLGAGCFAAASRAPTSGSDHAHAACDTWRSVVEQATDGYRPMIGDLDSMVADAKLAADTDSRYTQLWSDMREYRLFASQGENTTHTDYVSNDCASV